MALIEVSALGLATAGLAGAISFISPCVLPLVPGYVSYIAGGTDAESPSETFELRLVWRASCFVLGFTSVFILLGISAQALGGLLQRHQIEANIIGGALVIMFGLAITGLIKIPLLMMNIRWRGPDEIRGPVGAFLLGTAFAFGWTPCIGPVLASILALTAASASNGALLLGVYGLGLGLPFLLVALFFGNAAAALKRLRRAGVALNIASGAIMIAIGALLMTGRLPDIAIWLLNAFPALGTIG